MQNTFQKTRLFAAITILSTGMIVLGHSVAFALNTSNTPTPPAPSINNQGLSSASCARSWSFTNLINIPLGTQGNGVSCFWSMGSQGPAATPRVYLCPGTYNAMYLFLVRGGSDANGGHNTTCGGGACSGEVVYDGSSNGWTTGFSGGGNAGDSFNCGQGSLCWYRSPMTSFVVSTPTTLAGELTSIVPAMTPSFVIWNPGIGGNNAFQVYSCTATITPSTPGSAFTSK
jgi:hypothetical protein